MKQPVDPNLGQRHQVREPNGSDKIFCFGDSTLYDAMHNLGAAGDTKESRQPADTLIAQRNFIENHPGVLKNATVYISSLSNNKDGLPTLLKQIKEAKAAGANVVVVGMGDNYQHLNHVVQTAVEDKGVGAQFVPMGPNNGVHPIDPKKLPSGEGLPERLAKIGGVNYEAKIDDGYIATEHIPLDSKSIAKLVRQPPHRHDHKTLRLQNHTKPHDDDHHHHGRHDVKRVGKGHPIHHGM